MKTSHINYFDFGLYDGYELIQVRDILRSLQNVTYSMHGFEAHPEYCNSMSGLNDEFTNIHNVAISDIGGKINLYLADNGEGNSIFKTKNNVDVNSFIEVDAIVFSEWLQSNVSNYKDCINIIRVNIEGAEWCLFNDIINHDIHKYVALFCGTCNDIPKVAELQHLTNEFTKLLSSNKIVIHPYARFAKNSINMRSQIDAILNTRRC